MNSLYFWKNWNSPYKQIYFFLLFVFTLCLVALVYASIVGMEGVIRWDVETELEPAKTVIDQFARNMFNFTVDAESFYALDKFVTTEVQVNLLYAYIYLFVLVIGIVFILTTFSYLDLYWFLAGILLFLAFLFTLKIEMLQLFGRVDRMPMIAIFLAYGGVSYVYNAYFKAASYMVRLASFTMLTVVIALVIANYSAVATPFLYMVNFGSLFPVLATVIFVFIIGHDIIKGFLYAISGTKTAGSKNALLNFVFASLLYLVNVFLLLMKKLYVFDLNIVYLNPFLLLSVSAILGIWMFRKRTEMFATVLPFAPAGAYVYISLAIISFAGAVYAFLNGNIGIIEVYELVIVYGHVFVGFIFLLYVLANFANLFEKKISVYEILYKPHRMTYLVVPSIAITISAVFFVYQKKYPYQLSMAGYYTYAGDVMIHEKEYSLAFQYYKEAVTFDYPNHRANYSIASLCTYLDDNETAKGYYENALVRDPTPQSYVGLSNLYLKQGELFNALFEVQEGIKKFPGEGRLYNNLAVLYQKSRLSDSAVHYFLVAKRMMGEKEVAASNILYVLAQKDLIEEADSILKTENYPAHISFVNNKLALLNQEGKRGTVSFDPSLIKDTVLDANTYAYLVNASINSLRDTSALLVGRIDSLRKKVSNEFYKDGLTYQLALRKYYTGNRFQAIQDMIMLKAISSQSAHYPTILGSWMLEQEQYELASSYYRRSLELGHHDMGINYVFASIMAGKKDDALFVVSQLQDKELASLYESTIELLKINDPSKLSSLDEARQLQWFLYNLRLLPVATAEKLFSGFTNPVISVYAGAALCRYYVDKGAIARANEIYKLIEETKELNPFAERERNYTFLVLKAAMKEGNQLKEKAASLPLNADKELTRDYFIATAYALKGDTNNASVYYIKTLAGAPYVESIVPEAVRYLSRHGKQQETYNYLVEILKNDPSVPVLKAYLELCLDMELVSYAESTLNDLKGQITPEEYARYRNQLSIVEDK